MKTLVRLKLFAALVFLVALAAGGCATGAQRAERKELDALLAPDYVVPRAQRDEAYRLLQAFREHRRPKEYVYAIEIKEFSASVSFTNGGMHGGGVVYFRKDGGTWKMTDKYYFM